MLQRKIFSLLFAFGAIFCSLICPVAKAAPPVPVFGTKGLDFPQRQLQDWVFQDFGLESQKCFVDAKGFETEKKLVEKVIAELTENESASSANLKKELTELVSAKIPGNHPKWLDLYKKACTARRQVRLETVREEYPQIVYTKHYVIGASFYAYTEDTSDEEYRDFSRDRRPGGQLCLMTLLPNGETKNEILCETKEGTIRDPDVSWDGKRILFSMRKNYIDDDFHLYEYNIETKKVRQLTYGLGFVDMEPTYLPDGSLLFTSSRCVQITDCWWTEVSNLYTCDADGRFMRRISFDQVSVNYPKVLPDGRVTYTRWDYNDRGQVFPQPLYVMNSDGTGQTEYYGNNSWFPTSIQHARGIPDSSKVIAIAAGHHTYQHGKLMMIDRTKGTQENQGTTFLAPVRKPKAERIDQYGQQGELFAYPFAFSEHELLVSYLPEGRINHHYPIPFGVYYMDADGRRELLAWDATISCNQQIPLKARPVPPMRHSATDESNPNGRFYVHNVYEGPGLAGIEKGTIKSLRVVALEYRAAGIRKNGNGGEGGGAMVCTPIAVSNAAWDVKKVLGQVPVEEDGSALFDVPARTPVYFQLLDKNDEVVQTMRSWSTLQPGEFFACIGCHEDKGNTTVNVATATSLALKKGAQKLKPTYRPGKGIYQNAGFSYVRDIQPILDTYCVSCHSGVARPDGTRVPLDLTGNEKIYKAPPTPPGKKEPAPPAWAVSGRHFSESYLNLTNCGSRGDNKYIAMYDVQSAPPMLPPRVAGAFKSPLIKMFRGERDKAHQDVKIDEASLRKLALWIDLLTPYCGDYTEESDWTPEEKAKYAYYIMKREKMDAIVQKNLKLRQEVASGKIPLPAPETFERFTDGGPEFKKKFLADWLNRELPVLNRKSGAENVYRNLALNPNDVQGDAIAWPHASSNSEYARLDQFAAKNVINGKTANKGHSTAFPSWGPNRRSDLWLKVELGHEVETDKVVLWLRADFPHDSVWTAGTLVFSDGSTEKIKLEKTDKPQTFTFKSRKTNSVTLTNLETELPPGWCALTEFQVWGKSVE